MVKRGLGRGLEALIAGNRADESGALYELPVSQICTNPYQPRKTFNDERHEELVQSIRLHGVLQPILVRRAAPDRFELVAGERRLRAALAAGLTAVPAIVRGYETSQMLEIALVENLQREDINPVEAAHAYQRLRSEFNLTQEQIATRVGKAQSTIANSLRLLQLPPEVLDSLGSGQISEGHARAILQARPEARVTAWQDIRARGLSVRESERLCRDLASRTGGERSSQEQPARDPHIAALEEALRNALGTRVSLRFNGTTGSITIDFYSEDQLDGLVQRLVGEAE